MIDYQTFVLIVVVAMMIAYAFGMREGARQRRRAERFKRAQRRYEEEARAKEEEARKVHHAPDVPGRPPC